MNPVETQFFINDGEPLRLRCGEQLPLRWDVAQRWTQYIYSVVAGAANASGVSSVSEPMTSEDGRVALAQVLSLQLAVREEASRLNHRMQLNAVRAR